MATNTTPTPPSSSIAPQTTTTTPTTLPPPPPPPPVPPETTTTEDKIWHKTLGSPSNPPLLLLHGMFSSHLEFTPIIPFLEPHYYLILVDLPGHSRSRSPVLNNYRMPQTISALASLISEVSPTKNCHVAGMSYGGSVGLALARLYPDVVETLFVSGSRPLESEGVERFVVERPWLLYGIQAITTYAPDFLFNPVCRWAGVKVPEGLRKEGQQNFSYQAMKDLFGQLNWTLSEIAEIRRVRTAVVAGGKQDNVDVMRRMGGALREGDPGSGCKAFVVRKAIHAWDMQFPELFAEGIICWIEGKKMPEEFEELE